LCEPHAVANRGSTPFVRFTRFTVAVTIDYTNIPSNTVYQGDGAYTADKLTQIISTLKRRKRKMKKVKEKRFSLKTEQGCKRLLVLCLVIILIGSFFAYMLSSNWGRVKVSEVAFDSEGAILNGSLYVPTGINSKNSLPAILVTHGISNTHRVVNGIAEELARRGFVALSVDAYGAGNSETSDTVEAGTRGGNDSPQGIYDAANYLRTLKYVDKTRIGLVGHSQGSKRVNATVNLDCSYFTLNDLMINVLCNTFGQKFTYEEIGMDADKLAQERLNADQLVYYNALKAEKEKYIKNTIFAAIILGGNEGFGEKTVKVGGYDVVRTPLVNGAFQVGIFNEGRAGIGQSNLTSKGMMTLFQTSKPIVTDTWYKVKTYTSHTTPSSDALGKIFDTSLVSNGTLKDAIANRSTRIFFTPVNSHARDFFSSEATSYIVKYFEQVMHYNCGELNDPSTVPLDSSNSVFLLRELLNTIALLAMCIALIPTASLLMKTKFFSVCKKDVCEPISGKKDPMFWIMAAIYALAAYLTVNFINHNGPMLGFKSEFAKKFWSMDFSAAIMLIFMWIIAAVSLGLIIIFAVYQYKKKNTNIPKTLNVATELSTVWKYFLMSVLLFVLAYVSMEALQLFFHQDYRFWTVDFTSMLPQNFMLMLRYALVIFPTFLVGGVFTNAGRMKDMSDKWNTVLHMALSSVGMYLSCIISYGAVYIHYWQTGVGVLPDSAFVSTWPLLFTVPLTTYLTRKFYERSGSVWLGAFVNTCLVGWIICSSNSTSYLYLIGNFASKWLGL
jgi:hypothetical protein